MEPPPGKRKKKVARCPNPLMVQWLTELRDEAAARGNKSHFTYAKALRTLKKYPLTLPSGKACKILENFGDKICQILDSKLAQHVAEYGTTEPVDVIPEVEPTKHKKAKSQVPATEVPLSAVSHPDATQNKKRRASGPGKEYLPQYRSGPYALILTLYNDMQLAGSRGFMTKTELLRSAQPLAEKSFTLPEPGSRYTAWSSMGSLIQKGLIIKHSSPARYSLTDAGCALANKIQEVERNGDYAISRPDVLRFTIGDGQIRERCQQLTEDLPKHNPVDNYQSIDDFTEDNLASDLPLIERLKTHHPVCERKSSTVRVEEDLIANRPSESFEYCYVSDNGEDVRYKDKAAVIIDDEISVGFLIKCKYEDLLVSGKIYKLDPTKKCNDGYIYAYLSNDFADELSPTYTSGQKVFTMTSEIAKPHTTLSVVTPALTNRGPEPGYSSTTSFLLSNTSTPSHSSKSKNALGEKKPRTDVSRTNKQKAKPQSCPSTMTTIGENCRSVFQFTSTAVLNTQESAGVSSHCVEVHEQFTKTCVRECEPSQGSAAESVASNTADSLEYVEYTKPTPKFIFEPFTFDVVLCVDNAEYYGGCHNGKPLVPELQKNAVDYDLRKLQIGDFLWIAKEKVFPGLGKKPREMVLDFVVERKRMDDLAGSIVDGRFREQKFRMRNCGLSNPVYLVEAYGSSKHFSISEDTLNQAVINTQIIDGFFVKKTQNTKESAIYLSLLTQYLKHLYQNKRLLAYGKEDLGNLPQSDYTVDEHAFMTFDEFNDTAIKSKPLTVKEMFGKQIIQLHGVTVEKAGCLVEAYPTPAHLFDALDCIDGDREKEAMLASLKYGNLRRNLGTCSKQVVQLYSTENPLP